MNKLGGGIFSLPIMFVFIVLIIWVWATILPDALTPSIETTIADTAGAEHGDGVEFFLRMLPWMVPLILVLGMFWLGVTS